jgi:hypothetical protein
VFSLDSNVLNFVLILDFEQFGTVECKCAKFVFFVSSCLQCLIFYIVFGLLKKFMAWFVAKPSKKITPFFNVVGIVNVQQ